MNRTAPLLPPALPLETSFTPLSQAHTYTYKYYIMNTFILRIKEFLYIIHTRSCMPATAVGTLIPVGTVAGSNDVALFRDSAVGSRLPNRCSE